jgi:hypothetical protein
VSKPALALLEEGETLARALGISLQGAPRRMIAEGRKPEKRLDVLAIRRN